MTRKPRRSVTQSIALALLFLSPLAGMAVVWRAPAIQEERELARSQRVRAPRPTLELDAELRAPLQYRLVLQFRAEAQIRARGDGSLESLAGLDLGELPRLAEAARMSFAPLVRLPAIELQALEQRASGKRSARPLDLLGLLIARVPAMGLAQLEELATRLQHDPLVELAHIEVLGCPPPEDLAPITPDYSSLQAYRSDQNGLQADFANARGYRGSGIRVSDCEYGWNPAHEELRDLDLHPEAGQTPDPALRLLGYDEHGTAVAGLIKAEHNGFGIHGLAPDCELYTYPEWSVEGGFRRVESILAAAAGSRPGDVLLLEMQNIGPGGNYAPAEIDPFVFAAVRLASDAGVIVVAAAGNGAEDLDSPAYQSYRDRGHSGAILVGAGSIDANHSRLGFSTYGQRVDVQSWGHSVFSTGYGAYSELGGDRDQRYTSVFSGTSSAAALVAGALAVLQSAHLEGGGQALDAEGMRRLLLATGEPQGSGAPIGPAISLRAALESMPWVALVSKHLGDGSNPDLLDSLDVPSLGQSWTASINLSSYPSARSSALVFSISASAGVGTRYGQLLLDLSQPALAVFRSPVFGPSSSFLLHMPSDPAAVGMRVYCQGVVFADRILLTNSLELRLGHQ